MATKAEIAWAAGLYEGEGYASLNARGKATLGLGSTDEDVLLRFREIVSVGTVYGPYHKPSDKPHWKPQWVWRSTKRADILHVYTLIRPWLLSRRAARIDEVIATYGPNPETWKVKEHWRRYPSGKVAWIPEHERNAH